MVGVELVLLRHHLLEAELDRVRVAPRREAGPVRDAEEVGVDRDGRLAVGGVEDDVRRFPADAGQRLQLLAGARHLAAEFFDQFP